jgi:hypothetical protein
MLRLEVCKVWCTKTFLMAYRRNECQYYRQDKPCFKLELRKQQNKNPKKDVAKLVTA